MADGRQGQVGEKAAASLAADLALEAQLVAAACQQVLDREIQVVCTDQAQLPGAAHEVGAVVTRQLLGPAVQAQDVEVGVEAGDPHRRGVGDGADAAGGGDQVLVQPGGLQRGGYLGRQQAQQLEVVGPEDTGLVVVDGEGPDPALADLEGDDA